MLKRRYYNIQEAAYLLDVDIDTMLQSLMDYVCLLDIADELEVYSGDTVLSILDLVLSNQLPAVSYQLPKEGEDLPESLWDFVFTKFNEIEITFPHVDPNDHDRLLYLRDFNVFKIISKPRVLRAVRDESGQIKIILLTEEVELGNELLVDDLLAPSGSILADFSDLIIHSETIDMLKSANNPQLSTEWLLAEIDSLKAKIYELEVALIPINENKQKKREQCLEFWGYGKGYARGSKLPMQKEEVKTALMVVDPHLFSANFDEFWKVQKVYQLESGRPNKS